MMKPCPFCGSVSVAPINFDAELKMLDNGEAEAALGSDQVWGVSCNACHASSGWATTKAEAIKKWDQREGKGN